MAPDGFRAHLMHKVVIGCGNAKLKVRFASPASLKAGRSVGSFRLIFFAPRCARRVGRSGQPESVADALGRQGGSVGRVIPTQFFAAALRAAVGRSGHSDPIFLPPRGAGALAVKVSRGCQGDVEGCVEGCVEGVSR